jgi:hypothetical protein
MRSQLRLDDVQLVLLARVAERRPHEEAVELRLRQRERAFVLDRVVGRDQQERIVERPRLPVHGDLLLGHRFEERRLGLRSGAVDLVHEDDIREDRTGAELEALLALVVDGGADHVGGQQIGGALDAREGPVDRARERPRQRGLPHAGVVLDEHVAVGGQRDEHVVEHVGPHLDRPHHVGRDPPADGAR